MKRLLLQALALVLTVGAYAYEPGEYFYTPAAKFKVAGSNQLTNGDFSSVWADWNEGVTPNETVWSWSANGGPNGGAAAQSILGEATEGGALVRVVEGLVGTYVVSFKAKAAENVTTTITGLGEDGNYSQRYFDIFLNNDGSTVFAESTEEAPTRRVGGARAFTSEWQTFSDTVTIEPGQYLVFAMARQNPNTYFTDFSVNEIYEVYDTRYIEDRLRFADLLLSDEHVNDFKLDQESFENFVGMVEQVRQMLTTEGAADDKATMDDIMNSFDAETASFLSLNASDALKYNWLGVSKTQKANGVGAWSGSGGRWFRLDGGQVQDGGETRNSIVNYIQGTYDLPDATQYMNKTGQTPGKYMFSVKLRGYYMLGTGSDVRYTPDDVTDFGGAKIYINGDTIDCGYLPHEYYNTYTIFGTVAEDGVLNFGLEYINEKLKGSNQGGRLFMCDPILYQIGVSQADADLKALQKAIITQQQQMQIRVDSANTVIARNDIYKWGMQAVKDSLELIKPRLAASYDVVDQDGNLVALSLDTYEEYKDYATELTQYVRNMNTAFSNLYRLNAPYTTLVADVERVQAEKDGGEFASSPADRTTALEAALTEARNLYATYSILEGEEAAAESAKYTAMSEKLLAAQESYRMGGATYANHMKVQTVVVNPNFTANNTASGGTFPGNNPTGWTYTANDAGRENFKFRNGEGDGWDNSGCGVWRGSSVAPTSKLVQTKTISEPGVYRYQASAYAFSENNAHNNAMIQVITDPDTGDALDSLWTPSRVCMFFGPEGNPDSVKVHSHYSPNHNNTFRSGYWTSKYNVVYVKTTNTEETVEFGMDTFQQATIGANGANAYGFGDNLLLFGGDAAKFTADAKADLNTKINAANELVNKYIEDPSDYFYYPAFRLQRMVNHAKDAVAADNLTNILNSLDDLLEAMDDMTVITGIEAVKAAKAELVEAAAARGVYSLSGVKVANNLNALQKGLYIINGKKYVVK